VSRFDDFLAVLDDSEFEEIPVDIDTFVSDPNFLGGRKMRLSPIQRECVLMMTQIYRKDTLESFLTPEEVQKRWATTMNEVILMLGKGSGKDEMSAMAITYIVYLLLCLKDPAAYYNKPTGDNIDIINVAINAEQASNVFFKKFTNYIVDSPWFEGKYEAKSDKTPMKSNQFNFNKNINVYSGHSEREAWEGYNLFVAVLDEIAAFALESASVQGKTAEAIFDMYSNSVTSRFSKFGKVISLSFPRYKGDFITQRYDKVIASKQVVKRVEVLKINEDLPDGIAGNELRLEWDEDHIDAYTQRKVYALRRPPWDVNPIQEISDYIGKFVDNYSDSLGRYCCMPPEAVDAFFKDRDRIEQAFSGEVVANAVDNETGAWTDACDPDPDKLYFVHVDLAQKHDRCAVTLAHVEKWERRQIGDIGKLEGPAPVVYVDAIRYWQPTKQKEVDFDEVQDYIVSLQQRGYNLRLVTFDQWRSEDMRKYLASIGIRTDLLSVKKEQYVDFAVVLNSGRLHGPLEPLIREELLGLRLFPNGKIDHPRQGYKDLSDATAGAIFNAIRRTPRSVENEIEVKTVRDVRKEVRNEPVRRDNVITAPVKREMPADLAAYLRSARVI
jgi:hypothetical protein